MFLHLYLIDRVLDLPIEALDLYKLFDKEIFIIFIF